MITTTNIKSGFFISLIAMPLCLGIAIASSCPPIAGIITAIVGGLIISFFSGCELSIKGPAAGLIVVILAAVQDLGQGDMLLGYRRMLAVAVLAAVLQILFSLFKIARFGRLMPPSVIHGMLAAIGIIIVAKQIHILVGATPHGKTPLELLMEIPESIMNINPELAFMGIFTLALLLAIPLVPSKVFQVVPPALLALLVVVPLGLYWHLDQAHNYKFLGHTFFVGPNYLVNIPNRVLGSIVFPDFSILTKITAYKYVIMLSLVGSIESVLTVISVDSIAKTKSNLNKDLLGIGVGNLICALLGGLPMISEIVRSKANIDSGATSRWSNFFHGLFLLIFVSLLAPVIQEIPLAALAAMLMVTGLRLASPKQFAYVRSIGTDQLVLFTTTLALTLVTDLLIGILGGAVLKIIIHLFRGASLKSLFSLSTQSDKVGEEETIKVFGAMVFTNYLSFENKVLNACKHSKFVNIDFSNATLIDHTTLYCLKRIADELTSSKITLRGLERFNRASSHQLSTHRAI